MCDLWVTCTYITGSNPATEENMVFEWIRFRGTGSLSTKFQMSAVEPRVFLGYKEKECFGGKTSP